MTFLFRIKNNIDSKLYQGKLLNAINCDEEGRTASEDNDVNITSHWYEKDTGKKHVIIDGKPPD